MAAEWDEDFNPQGSRSSAPSDDSDYMGDTEGQTPPSKPSNQHRSIVASSTLSRAQQLTRENLPAEAPPFTFLDQECYTCSCHTPSSYETRCTVLGFFRLSFFQSWNAIFCPLHNCIIPASKLERHLHKAHQEWTSPIKAEESRKMAQHIATTCGLGTRQKAEDILAQLPEELEDPPVSKGIYLCYRCPLCASWHAHNTGAGSPDRYLRRHLKEHSHDNGMDLDVGEPRWTYRVKIYPQDSTHVFILPEDFSGTSGDSSSEASIPPRPSLSTNPDRPSEAISTTQDWPLLLGWEAYSIEIQAGAYVNKLRELIGRCGSIKNGQTSFLEKGLFYVRCFSIKYMKGAGSIMKSGVIRLDRAVVSE